MLTFLITSLLLANPQAGAPAAAPAAAAKKVEVPADLKKAAAAVTDSKGYAFEAVVETTGGFGRGGRGPRGEGGGAAGGGAGAPPAGGAPAGGAPAAGAGGRGGPEGPQTITGKFEKGKPVAMTRDDQTVYRLDQQIVYSKDGTWEVYTPGQFGPGGPGGPRGQRGGAAGGPPAGAPPAGGAPAGGAPAGGPPPAGGAAGGGPGFGGGDFRRIMTLSTFANLTLPHEVLASLDTALSEVKREEKDGKVVFSGPLSADAADKLSGAARMKEMMARFAQGGGGGGGAPEIASSGTMSITVNKDGAIESIHVDTKITGGMGGDQTRKVDVKLSGVGATTVDVPKEVLAKLST